MEDSEQTNKKRCRKKNKLKLVKRQIEFFFSDANLSRDKYLLEKTGPEGTNYVALGVLLQFKSIKSIGAQADTVVAAIKSIDWLKLDDQEQGVCRRFKLESRKNVDHLTMYVEGLPDDATVEWMKQVCSKLGKTNHIYLPRYNSGVVKGYAFVEFQQEDDVYRACNILNSPPSNFFPNRTSSFLLHHSKTNSSSADDQSVPSRSKHCCLKSTAVSPQSSKKSFKDASLSAVVANATQQTNKTYNEDCGLEVMMCEEIDTFKTKKQGVRGKQNNGQQVTNNFAFASVLRSSRKRCVSEPMLNKTHPDTKKCKKDKKSGLERNQHVPKDSGINGEAKSDQITKYKYDSPADVDNLISYARLLDSNVAMSKSNDNSQTTAHTSTSLMSVVTVPKTKNHRKRRSRKRKNISSKQKTSQNPPQIKALPKTLWLSMKKSYISKQREEMGKLKSILQHTALSNGPASTFIKRHLALEENVSLEEISSSGNGYVPKAFHQSSETSRKHVTTTFSPGVIIYVQNFKVQSDENIGIQIAQAKQHFSSYGQVAYVDIRKDKGCYIRFANAQSAQNAILEEQVYSLSLLTGVAEETYWDNLLASKQAKRSRERPKVRGRQKLVIKAMELGCQTRKQHIKFNEDY